MTHLSAITTFTTAPRSARALPVQTSTHRLPVHIHDAMSLPLRQTEPKELCLQINARSPEGGLFEGDRSKVHPESRLPWRISPEPYWITPQQLATFEALGPVLLSFYQACNLLYQQSVKGIQPEWVSRYMDQGKPANVVEFGRMNRFKSHLPLVMRPDLLVTQDGFRIAELDAIPGGMGFTGNLAGLYTDLGYDLIGGASGLTGGFYDAIADSTQVDEPVVAIVVSDESQPYWDEMFWLAQQIRATGRPILCVHAQDIRVGDDGVYAEDGGGELIRIDAVYRFFELFDLKNIPRVELVTYFAKKNAVRVTPPLKAYLEEKMWLALYHHPQLGSFWRRELDSQALDLLGEFIPESWIVDATPAPPHTVIANLEANGEPISSWDQLGHLSKKQREFVLKPSGFTEMAYGSKGVSIGHDLPEEEWSAHIDRALNDFHSNPYILQRFHKAQRKTVRYYDFDRDEIRLLHGRALLRPYYYTGGERVQLAGIQAVVCPPDKKLIHGMADAIITPCAVGPELE